MKRSDVLMVATAVVLAVTAVATAAAPRGEFERPSFSDLDVDGDGVITAADIDALREARFAALDGDGDGEVTREEFAAASRIDAGNRADQLFDRLDADGDGVLSRDVLEQRERGPNSRIIERFDADGDGGLSEAEFEEVRARMSEGIGKRGGFRGGSRDN